ncbi:MAG: hypothetical protein K2Y25_09325 [Pseudomonadaceae bacterium]|nr:hypothetical protein [Pseudomonadaceae bacterium]
MAIKVYRSTDLGAPALTGAIGSMIPFLDAVLVDGYNSISITSITRVGATATVVCAVPHGLVTGDSALMAGAAQTSYNVDAVVTVLSGTSFTYDVAGSPATPATGTITCKRAPGGFAKVFTGSNKAAYRSFDVTGNRFFLRILDDGGSAGGTRETRAYGYESMTDVDTGTNPFPTAAQSANGYYWIKSSTTDAVARAWTLVTNGKLLYLFVDYGTAAALGMSANGAFHSAAFGDTLSYKPGDAYATIITGGTTANQTTAPFGGLGTQAVSITSTTTFASSIAMAREFTGIAGARYVGLMGSCLAAGFGTIVYLAYPHMIDNGYYATPVQITQGAPALIRGRMPGMYEGMHGRALNNGDIVENFQGLSGRKLLMMYTHGAGSPGCIMLDITGPWDA